MRRSSTSSLAWLAIMLGVLQACETEPGETPTAPSFSFESGPEVSRWSDWSEPVNLGSPVNSTFTEQNSALSMDGLTLYIQSNRTGTLGGNDLWVSGRATLDSPWEEPVHLGSTINSPGADGGPFLSADEHLLFIHSDRTGSFGGNDLWVSRRVDTDDPFGWEPPTNLGPEVNTAEAELSPAFLTVGPGGHTLYFQRGPQQSFGVDIYQAAMTHNGVPLGPADLVQELSVAGANDASPSPSRDGREIIFASTRLGGGGGLFVSTRRSPHDEWSVPVSLGGSISANANGSKLSIDGSTLMFFSTRAGGVGGFDLWAVTRTPGNGGG